MMFPVVIGKVGEGCVQIKDVSYVTHMNTYSVWIVDFDFDLWYLSSSCGSVWLGNLFSPSASLNLRDGAGKKYIVYISIYLDGGLEHFLFFHNIWDNPFHGLIFFIGVETEKLTKLTPKFTSQVLPEQLLPKGIHRQIDIRYIYIYIYIHAITYHNIP